MNPRFVLRLLAASFFALSSAEAAESEAEVRVLGRITVEARRLPLGHKTRWEGLIKDELGRVLPSATLRFAAPTTDCEGGHPLASLPVRPDGSFCVLIDEPNLSLPVRVLSADHFESTVVVAKLPETIFEPRLELTKSSHVWHLESPDSTLETGVTTSGFPSVADFTLHASCSGANYELGRFPVEKEGPTFVRVSAPDTLPAGRCALFATGFIAGGRSTNEAKSELLVERPVHLALDDTHRGVHEIVAKSSAGQPVSGMLEARRKDGSYAAGASIRKGRASLDLAHLPHEEITLRYLPGPPWYRAGETLSFVHEPPRNVFLDPRFHLVLLLVALGYLGSKILRKEKKDDVSIVLPDGQPHVAVIARDRRIVGRVRDAHTKDPTLARVRLFRKQALGEELLEETVTAEDGSFSFPAPSDTLLELEVSGDELVTLRTPVRRGRVDVFVAARRRALLAHLEKLVRARPDLKPTPLMPTPEQLRREADADARPEDAQWATAIDQLAYGPEEPEESAVSSLTPPIAPSTAQR